LHNASTNSFIKQVTGEKNYMFINLLRDCQLVIVKKKIWNGFWGGYALFTKEIGIVIPAQAGIQVNKIKKDTGFPFPRE
jgi:hypothetical protein